MLGKMLWFNRDRDAGFIVTDDDERIAVHGSDFANGVKPQRRCARAPVEFEIREHEGERRAENVLFIEEDSPRRARRRSRSIGGR
jgi:cold shock CspA family protein